MRTTNPPERAPRRVAKISPSWSGVNPTRWSDCTGSPGSRPASRVVGQRTSCAPALQGAGGASGAHRSGPVAKGRNQPRPPEQPHGAGLSGVDDHRPAGLRVADHRHEALGTRRAPLHHALVAIDRHAVHACIIHRGCDISAGRRPRRGVERSRLLRAPPQDGEELVDRQHVGSAGRDLAAHAPVVGDHRHRATGVGSLHQLDQHLVGILTHC